MKAGKLILILILTLSFTVSVMTASAKERSEIPDKYKWRTDHMYASVDDWQKDFDFIKENIQVLASYKGKFAGPDAADPAKALIEYNVVAEQVWAKFERVWIYVARNYHVDLNNSDWAGMLQQCRMLGVEYGQMMAFFNPELLLIPQETLIKLVDENPALEPYRKSYNDLYAQQEHVLSEPEERILALSGNITGTSGDVYGKFTDADMRFAPIKDENGDEVDVTDSGWVSWRTNKDRQVRTDYWTSVWSEYDKYGTTIAAMMNGNVMKDVYLTEARGYENTLEASLSGNFIPTQVYENLVNTTRANTGPLHKYNELRKNALGVDHYRHYDYYVSIVDFDDEERYSWEEGVDIVVDALQPMGKDYINDIKFALNPENGWVDPYAHAGKRGGAYSGGCYGVHGFMLYNFDYDKGLDYNDVSTICHEVGHSMHSRYSEEDQHLANKDYAIFNAEVASTVNEAVMSIQHLDDARKQFHKVREYKDSKNAEKQAKYKKARQKLMYLLESNVDAVRQTFYRQTLFATWEWEAHKLGENGQPMTRDSYSELYGNLLKEFHGEAAEYEELSNMSWARIPHFYRGYYVYSYATSYAAAYAIAQDILAESKGDKSKKGTLDRYMDFLGSGSSQHPVELLKDAGVDMSKPEPILALINAADGWVDELAQLLEVK